MDIEQQKPKISVENQIANMKRKGITFKYITEEEAKDYLLNHTYYFKFKSYSKNYEKYNKNRKYMNLDFSYLQDLARLDMYFREIILKMTIDIEHFLKVQILSESQKNQNDNGYKIVEDFLSEHRDIKEKIQLHSKNGYHSELIKKYQQTFPIWVFLEIISFGDLVKFYGFYTNVFPIGNNVSSYLWSARILRNAAAHNSCILNRLTENFDDEKINGTLMDTIKRNYPYLGGSKIKHYLKNPVIQDFLDVLVLYLKLDKSHDVLRKRIKEIDHVFHRCRKHASYYKKNQKLRDVFRFVYTFFCEYKKSLTK